MIVRPSKHSSPRSFLDVKVMNLSEDKKEFEYPGDDPSWLVPYHGNHFEPVIQGISYYFSVSLQNQILREKTGKKMNKDLPLNQTDLDFSRGNTLAHRLIQVMRFSVIFFLI